MDNSNYEIGSIVAPEKKAKKVSPPFGYFGSKNKLAFELCKNLPPHSCWVEAFCGSAALTLAKGRSPIEVINDIDDEIYNFFLQLRDNNEGLINAVQLTPYSRKELENARIKNYEDDDLERARKFLIQSMMAINGVFGHEKGGFSYSQSYSRNGRDARVNRWLNLPKRLDNVIERLRDVRLENRDAIEIVEMFRDRPATLLYLDPPYLAKRTKGYSNDQLGEEFHIRLLKASLKSKAMIFVSGYENELYDDILDGAKGWTKKKLQTTTQGVNGDRKSRTEVVWMNKIFTKAVEENKLPLRLTKTELRDNKVNPVRK